MLKTTIEQILNGWIDATREPFTSHPIANAVRQSLKQEIQKIISNEYPDFTVVGSAGAGNWANIPWLTILNPKISTSTQDGIYPGYLFRADGSGVYLSLNQGTTNPQKMLGKLEAEKRANKISTALRTEISGLKEWGTKEIFLRANTALGKSYELPNIVAKFYDAQAIPSEAELVSDLLELMSFYKKIEPLWDSFKIQGELKEVNTMTNTSDAIGISLPKPFILLAGISGTGKTRFVREQAKAQKDDLSNYCLIPVRPNWHEPSDLLGYVSRIGNPRYVVTDLLLFVVKAWKDAAQSATVNAIVTKSVDAMTPYWLCLDEMNLAPVEQYFADYLSVLESREWAEGAYRCLPLLKAELFNKDEGITEQLRKDLGLDDTDSTDLWNYFKTTGIPLPPNLIVAGTVNMDETTHGFSRKVIDRAFTIDFGAFFPNDFSHYFAPATVNKTLSFPVLSKVEPSDLSHVTADPDGSKSIAFLDAINTALKNTPFELAFRALNELLISLVCFKPKDDAELQAVWDDFLMTKVLPRIDGDGHKLGLDGEESLLTKLENISKQQMSAIWHTQRPDLLRENRDQTPLLIACRSAQKLRWMQKRLADNSFTSFWP